MAQPKTEIVVPYSTIDDIPHGTTMYMYLRGGSRSFRNEEPFFLLEIYRDLIQRKKYNTW